MTVTINDLFEKELELKNHRIIAQNTPDDLNKIKELELEIGRYGAELSRIKPNSRIDYCLEKFTVFKIPMKVLQESSLNALSGNISEFDQSKLNTFFSEQFNINIENLDFIRVCKMPDKAEAFATACGTNQHYVAIPTIESNAFLSYDLLIHEIGHTVEYNHRRNKADISYLLTFPMISEAIAHYYQMVYMLKNSTKENRLGMLASTTNAYFFLRCMQIMRKIDPKNPRFNFDAILRHPDFTEFYAAYGGSELLGKLVNELDNKEYAPILHEQHAQRLGVFIALNMIKFKFDIKDLLDIKVPTESFNLTQLIDQTGIKSKVLLNFKNMGSTIESFVSGSLAANTYFNKNTFSKE